MINNLFYFKYLRTFGTEQFLYEVAKKYGNECDIVVAYEEGNIDQLVRLSKYVGLIKWKKGQKIACKKAFLNYNIDIIDDLDCENIYFVNHSNFEITKFEPKPHPRIKKCIAVSEFSKFIYTKHYKTPCEVSYNPISVEKYEKPLVLMSAFRGDDKVKGTKRVQKLVESLDKYCFANNKRYLYYIFTSNPCVPIESPNVAIFPPRIDVRAYMQLADWGITLSDDMETYCYTNVEFLMYGVPLVTTPLTVCDELKMDSSMRLIVDFDMSNVDEIIDQMFNRKMEFHYIPPKDRWGEILSHDPKEEEYVLNTVKVKATSYSWDRQIVLLELGRPAKPGEIFETTEDRIDNLVHGKNRYNAKFGDLI